MLRLGKELLIFDGGMGSELERIGLGGNDPMALNLTPQRRCAAFTVPMLRPERMSSRQFHSD